MDGALLPFQSAGELLEGEESGASEEEDDGSGDVMEEGGSAE